MMEQYSTLNFGTSQVQQTSSTYQAQSHPNPSFANLPNSMVPPYNDSAAPELQDNAMQQINSMFNPAKRLKGDHYEFSPEPRFSKSIASPALAPYPQFENQDIDPAQMEGATIQSTKQRGRKRKADEDVTPHDESLVPAPTATAKASKAKTPPRELNAAPLAPGYSTAPLRFPDIHAARQALNKIEWVAPRLTVELTDALRNMYARLIFNAMIDLDGFLDKIDEPEDEDEGGENNNREPHLYNHRLLDRTKIDEEALHMASFNIVDKLEKLHTVGTSARGRSDPTLLDGNLDERNLTFHERLHEIINDVTVLKKLVLDCLDDPNHVETLIVLAPKHTLHSRMGFMRGNDYKSKNTKASKAKKEALKKQAPIPPAEAKKLKLQEANRIKAKAKKLAETTLASAGPVPPAPLAPEGTLRVMRAGRALAARMVSMPLLGGQNFEAEVKLFSYLPDRAPARISRKCGTPDTEEDRIPYTVPEAGERPTYEIDGPVFPTFGDAQAHGEYGDNFDAPTPQGYDFNALTTPNTLPAASLTSATSIDPNANFFPHTLPSQQGDISMNLPFDGLLAHYANSITRNVDPVMYDGEPFPQESSQAASSLLNSPAIASLSSVNYGQQSPASYIDLGSSLGQQDQNYEFQMTPGECMTYSVDGPLGWNYDVFANFGEELVEPQEDVSPIDPRDVEFLNSIIGAGALPANDNDHTFMDSENLDSHHLRETTSLNDAEDDVWDPASILYNMSRSG